jgi:hypothetical protein
MMPWLLRLFGIVPEPAPMVEQTCPTCGHTQSWPVGSQDATDAFLSGASLSWFEQAIDRELRHRSP